MSTYVLIPGSEDDVPGQVQLNPRGDEARERAKWEQFDTPQTRRSGVTAHFKPGNPPEKRSAQEREFPKELKMAKENPLMNGKLMCQMSEPPRWEYPTDDQWVHACDAARAFTQSCQRVVKDAAEQQAAFESGWRETVQEAMEAGNARQFATFKEATHRAHDDRHMSEKAQAEVKAAEAAADGKNLPEIKEQPRGWTKEKRASAAAKRKATLAAKAAKTEAA